MTVNEEQLEAILPHRTPILMVDEVADVDPGKKGIGRRTFQEGDPVFEGHFPEVAILPGVLTIEAFAQTALVVAMLDNSRDSDARDGRLAKVVEFAFLEPVYPGMTVEFQIEIEKRVGPFVFVNGQSLSNGQKISQGKLVLKL